MNASAHQGYVIPAADVHGLKLDQKRPHGAIYPPQMQDMSSSGAMNFHGLSI